jgi:hypothetical protein
VLGLSHCSVVILQPFATEMKRDFGEGNCVVRLREPNKGLTFQMSRLKTTSLQVMYLSVISDESLHSSVSRRLLDGLLDAVLAF